MADPESFRDQPEAFLFLDSVIRLLQDTQNLVHAPDPILHRSRPSPLQTLLDGKVKQTGGTSLELKKDFGSVLPDKRVRIVTLRKRHDSHADPAPAEQIQRPQRGPHAGWVRIEQQHHVRDELLQLRSRLEILRRSQCAIGRTDRTADLSAASLSRCRLRGGRRAENLGDRRGGTFVRFVR